MATSEEELLQAEFLLYPKKNKINVKLTKTVILINPCGNSTKSESINVSDVIGCHVLEGNEATAARWYLCVFSYPLKKKVFKGLCRQRISKSFGVACCDSEDQNKVLAEKWKRVIQHLARGKVISKSQVNDLPEIALRHFVVFINPFSGQGKSIQIYRNHVKPMFAEADITCKTIETERSNHAHGMVKQMDFNQYDGIIIVSGDGLVHEIINGLMEREDWEKAIKTPIGIVASGSGNALAASIVYASTGCHQISAVLLSSIFEICIGNTVPCDVMAIETPAPECADKRTVAYGVLGVVTGMVADVDIESERLRCLGGDLRNAIYGVLRIATLRSYKHTLSYLQEDDSNENFTAAQATEDTESDEISATKSPADCSEDTYTSNGHTSSLKNHLLHPFSCPVPSNWKRVEGNFIQVSATHLTHIGQGLLLTDGVKFSDGLIRLVSIKSTASRLNMMKYWGNMEDGVGVSDETTAGNLSVSLCRAFRMEPDPKRPGNLTLDGERLHYGPIQGQIHRKLGRIFCSVKNLPSSG